MKRIARKIRNFIGRILRIRKIILIPSLIIIIGLLAFGIVKLVDLSHWVLHEPEFCLTCHIMDDAYAKWETSSHSEVECHDCHKLDIPKSMVEVYKYVFKGYKQVVAKAEVPNTLCQGCHEQEDSNWAATAATAGHAAHDTAGDVLCQDCHSTGVHEFVNSIDNCTECHTDITHGQGMKCTACHKF